MRSPKSLLALIALGILCTSACSADKNEVKRNTHDVSSAPPSMRDGIYSGAENLQAVYFGLNQSKLTEGEVAKVKANAEYLKSQPPYLVRIVGFADPRGSVKKNERLAERRAMSLRDAYAALGIPAERISLGSRTEAEPACQPVTEECLSRSRRAETLFEDKTLAAR